jgi:hypothetical protein
MSRDYPSFFRLEPEVAGGPGAATVLDSSTHPPRVARLEYHFDGWLGDNVLRQYHLEHAIVEPFDS